ncbi:DUF1295-domain-containing protein [Cryphonectria parasitica EP155]|uniref:DUF1295-domain-containing protein n=1 Tax=Cryphonectria parasitica (strain ATCC 38755 / EP155) TaxID=660469 RepID=A0A9P5CU10_CRYP1|nr:DUF1295-domain-containing protein [Cryphonectria parasitica EP155]KAF3770001.1 DUF1295-domain-containing protein [Cryphonectria parasitica EP155]
MALPALHTFEDCADWSKTVQPYFSHLYELPNKLVDVLQGRQGIVDVYTQTNPLISGFAISVFFGAIFLVVAEFNKNYSQVDRCWSLLPTFYIAHFDLWARLTGVPSARIDALLAFSAVWSARLTYNYWRKGGYTVGSEDYRWDIIRDTIPVWAFKILNVTFISFQQSIILYALAAPVYPILLSIQFRPELDATDMAFVAFELALITTEWFADQQQWDFQNAKHDYRKTAKLPQGYHADDLNRGFITSGLWAYSRHPNFAMEQAIWISLYALSAYITNTFSYWAAAGAVSLISIFFGSTILTEWITAKKYPEYTEYQRQVGKFIPRGANGYQPPVIPVTPVARAEKKKPIKKK